MPKTIGRQVGVNRSKQARPSELAAWDPAI